MFGKAQVQRKGDTASGLGFVALLSLLIIMSAFSMILSLTDLIPATSGHSPMTASSFDFHPIRYRRFYALSMLGSIGAKHRSSSEVQSCRVLS